MRRISRRTFIGTAGAAAVAPVPLLAQAPTGPDAVESFVIDNSAAIFNQLVSRQATAAQLEMQALLMDALFTYWQQKGTAAQLESNVASLPDEIPYDVVVQLFSAIGQQAGIEIPPDMLARVQLPTSAQISAFRQFVAQNGIAPFHSYMVDQMNGVAGAITDQYGAGSIVPVFQKNTNPGGGRRPGAKKTSHACEIGTVFVVGVLLGLAALSVGVYVGLGTEVGGIILGQVAPIPSLIFWAVISTPVLAVCGPDNDPVPFWPPG